MNARATEPLTAEQAERLSSAFRLLQQGDTTAAMSIARDVAMQLPRSADAQHLLALCHKSAGNREEAQRAFQDALALAPANPQMLANYANLLKSIGRVEEALPAYRDAVAAAPGFVHGWISLGAAALEAGRPAEARDALEQAIRLEPASASGWHALGRVHRAEGKLESAEAAFRKAVSLSPENGMAWVNLSVVVKLLGRPAEALPFIEEARKSGFSGPELDDSLSGALIDLGDIEAALAVIRRLTIDWPRYVPGHVTLAHLLWEYGDLLAQSADPVALFREAALKQPGNGPLQLAFIQFLMQANHAEEAVERIRRLRTANTAPALAIVEANALETLGRTDVSGALYKHVYDAMGVRSAAFLNSYTRHLLKNGQWRDAEARATEATESDPTNQEAWGYLATALRLLGHSREHWLCDYERTIALVEVEPPPGLGSQSEFIATLAATLDPLHRATREPVNQSLRGGSQTPGRLFGRPDPVILETQAAITRAVERHIAALPDDAEHPFFGRKERSVMYTGSWSVKLWSSGRHINHFHPQGWMSSAYYVSLPPSVGPDNAGAERAGWIQFGQPPEDLGLDLPPRKYLQPKVGHVALFPSYMWHGTVPFEDAEPRITVAFDMLPVA